MEYDYTENKFVVAFINEYDAYFSTNMEARFNSGLGNYAPRKVESKVSIINYVASEEDHLFFYALKFNLEAALLRERLSPEDIIASVAGDSMKDSLCRQWIELIGTDEICHSKVVYRWLSDKNIPNNILMPILLSFGLDNSIYNDKNLSEAEFIEKYKEKIWLPTIVSESNKDAIVKLWMLTLNNHLNEELKKSENIMPSDYDIVALDALAQIYCTLKSQYSHEYEDLLQNLHFGYISEKFPPLMLLFQFMGIDSIKEQCWESIFLEIHKSPYSEHIQEQIEYVISAATIAPRILSIYEHFCSVNSLIPKQEIIGNKIPQKKNDPKIEFVEKYRNSRIELNSEYSLGLSELDGEKVYDLYHLLIGNSIEQPQTSLYQFCYALTGKLKPDSICMIHWTSKDVDLAIFVTYLFGSQGKRREIKKILEIFTIDGKELSSQNFTSKCFRAEMNDNPSVFEKQLQLIIGIK